MNSTGNPSGPNDGHKVLVDMLFAKFSAIYGHAWRTLFKTPDFLEFAKAEWLQAIAPFKEKVIKDALEICRNKNKFPPSIPEFVDYCKQMNRRQDFRVKQTHQKANPKVVEFNLYKIKQLLGMK